MRPSEFLDSIILPALFARLDVAFPEFGWRKEPSGWIATNRDFTKSTFGSRPDRVVCHRPCGFLVHGTGPVSWLAYVNGGATPSGSEFRAALDHLAQLAQAPNPPSSGAALRPFPRMAREVARRPGPDFTDLAIRRARETDPRRIQALATHLAVQVEALERLLVSYSAVHCAYAFPMQDAVGQVVGARFRTLEGRKWSVRGGREGLSVPTELTGSGHLLLPEGATDTATVLGLGFDAIGRPSCGGGVRLAAVKAAGRDCVVLADADLPGLRSAQALAATLRVCCPTVRLVAPPQAFKDFRDWCRAGASRRDLLALIEGTEPFTALQRCQGPAREMMAEVLP